MFLKFDKIKLQDFKKAYENALQSNKQSFFFEEKEFILDYAKYCIEYLENKFNV